MQWTPGGVSGDIEDRRSQGGGGFRGTHLGIGGTILLLLLSIVFRRDFVSMFSGSPGVETPSQSANRAVGGPAEERLVQFVSFVLDDAQSTWDRLLPGMAGVPYRHAKLVLFRDVTDSACGTAQSATGPFYCPANEKVYIDLGFFDELKTKLGAQGEFAQAYVLAHEIGHHVQKILGTAGQVEALQRRGAAANPLSVRLELQADCYAGIWGHSTAQRKLIDSGDVESGLQAAGAVGDDRLQRMSEGYVSPETFTHGASEQRVAWFERGLEDGNISRCNTFESR
jgi:predicted metalloprotease